MLSSRLRPPSADAVRALLATACAAVLLCVVVTPASAASVPQNPQTSWAPWAACAGNATTNCASVRAITRTADGNVWLAGSFSQLRSPDGRQSVARGNLAALRPDGTPAASVRGHTFNGIVYTLATDGTSVYAGGAFTAVDAPSAGSGALRVARFDAATGNRMTFASGVGPASPSTAVYASSFHAGRLYIGGKFTTVQGSARGNLAALDPASGRVDGTWAPRAEILVGDASPNDAQHNNTPIRSIAAAPEGNRIYVAGDMDLLDGVARPVIAAVHPVSGATDVSFAPPSSLGKTFQGFSIATADASDGRTAGVVLAAGGLTNRAYRFRLDGSQAWVVNTDGDVQAAAVVGRTAYFGGHFACVSTGSCFDSNTVDDVEAVHVAAFDYESTGNPVADPSWAPKLGPEWSPYYYGVWALAAIDDELHAGGVFNEVRVGNVKVAQPKYVRFGAPRAVEPPVEPPVDPPPPAQGALFEDDFAAGSFTGWNSVGGGFSVVDQVATGVTPGKIATASKNLGRAYSGVEYTLRVQARSLDPGKRVVLARMVRTGAPASLVTVYVGANGNLGYRNELAGVDRNTTVPLGQGWRTLTVAVTVSGEESTVEVRLDGTPVPALSRTESLGTAGVSAVQLGDSAGGKTYSIDYDDVRVAALG